MSKLIVMTGLPGTGKSSLARALGDSGEYTILSADPIEAALHRSGIDRGLNSQQAAYEVMFSVAEGQLSQRGNVIIDAVNPKEGVRLLWVELGRKHNAEVYIIQCFCSDEQKHEERISNRNRSIPGFKYEPEWRHVKERIIAQEVSESASSDIRLDCAKSFAENTQRLRELVG